MANEKPTVEIQAVPEWAVALKKSIDRVEAKVDDTREEQSVFRKDVCDHFEKLERKDAELATRIDSKSPSKHDLENESKIALEMVAREQLSKDVSAVKTTLEAHGKVLEQQNVAMATTNTMLTAITEGATKVAANPTFRILVNALIGALVALAAYLSSHK